MAKTDFKPYIGACTEVFNSWLCTNPWAKSLESPPALIFEERILYSQGAEALVMSPREKLWLSLEVSKTRLDKAWKNLVWWNHVKRG